jgi:tripartite-type tricarboxylate transporter receptor subunit TctC
MFADASALGYVTDGKLRALAVTTARRLDELPNVPAADEAVPGFEVSGFLGIGAPKGTSEDIIAKLNGEIGAAVRDIALNTRLRSMGYTAFVGSPTDFRRFIAGETEKWSRLIRTSGIKPE